MDPFLSESDPSGNGVQDAGSDVELLKKAWKNEKAAPDILPYEEDLVKRIQQLLEDAVGQCASAFQYMDCFISAHARESTTPL